MGALQASTCGENAIHAQDVGITFQFNGREETKMPIKVICSNCGHQLASYIQLPYHGLDEFEPFQKIIEHYHGKCPKCGHKLAKKPANIEIRGLE